MEWTVRAGGSERWQVADFATMRHPDAYAYSDCNVYSNAYSYSDGNADANGNAHAAEANTDATAATHAPAQAVARVRSDPPMSGSRRTTAEKLVIRL